MRKQIVLILALTFPIIKPAVAQEYDAQRAIKNYQAVQSGKVSFESLSEAEKTELGLLIMASKSKPPKDTRECKESWESAESKASQLSDYSNQLKRCIDAGNYEDDCSTKFRNVKYAYSDYESAVSQVHSECN